MFGATPQRDHLVRTQVRVAVLSPSRLLRDSIVACLDDQPDLVAVGHTDDRSDLTRLCALVRPDVVLIEAESRIADAVEVMASVREEFPDISVIVAYDERAPKARALVRRGAARGHEAFISSSRGLVATLAAVRELGDRVNRRRTRRSGRLTERERELLMLLAAGHTAPEIAELTGLSQHTVDNHKRRIYAKLGAANQAHAVGRATALGLLGPATRDEQPPNEAEPGRPTLAVVRGGPGQVLDEVLATLVASLVPVLVDGDPAPPPSHGLLAHRGHTVVVLVRPTPRDWHRAAEPAAPIVVVDSGASGTSGTSGTRRTGGPADAVRRGAVALVDCARVADHLVPTLRLVVDGYAVLDTGRARVAAGLPPAPTPTLSVRERDILRSIASGHTVRQTASALGISAKTVENHQTRLFYKLGARNRAEALAASHEYGLLPAAGFEPLPPREGAGNQEGWDRASVPRPRGNSSP